MKWYRYHLKQLMKLANLMLHQQQPPYNLPLALLWRTPQLVRAVSALNSWQENKSSSTSESGRISIYLKVVTNKPLAYKLYFSKKRVRVQVNLHWDANIEVHVLIPKWERVPCFNSCKITLSNYVKNPKHINPN